MPRSLPIALVLLALFAFVSPTHAQSGLCSVEIAKFCKGVERGGGRIRACLKEHESELSPGCKQQITETAKRVDTCKPDIEKFCSKLQPGTGALRACLSEHLDELSEGCKAQMGGDSKP